MEINVCVGKISSGKKDFPEIAKIEVTDINEYVQTRDLTKLIREKMNDPKVVIIKTIFVSKDNNLFVYLN